MSANFDIEITGSTVGGLTVGDYTRHSSGSSTPFTWHVVPDTVSLPASYFTLDGNIMWNDIAELYFNEGAYYTGTKEPRSYHRLVQLNPSTWITMVIELNDTSSPDTPTVISNGRYYIEDTANDSFTLCQAQPSLLGDTYTLYPNYFFLYREFYTGATPNESGICVGNGAYDVDNRVVGEESFVNAAIDMKSISRLRPNQRWEISRYFFSGDTDESNNILNSVGNAGSAAWDASQDTIDLPSDAQP